MRGFRGFLKALAEVLLVFGYCALALVACAHKPIIEARVVELPVTKFVPIDAALLVPCAIAEGPLSRVIDVARERKAALETCNGQLEAIRALQPKDADP